MCVGERVKMIAREYATGNDTPGFFGKFILQL